MPWQTSNFLTRYVEVNHKQASMENCKSLWDTTSYDCFNQLLSRISGSVLFDSSNLTTLEN